MKHRRIHFGQMAGDIDGCMVVTGANAHSARTLARQLAESHADLCALPAMRITADPEHHDAAMEYARRCASLLDNLGNSVRDSFEGLDAAARNLQRFGLRNTSDGLRGAHASQPALCIGAGPSVQHNIQAIAASAPYARVFACDAITGALRDAGVTPDYVCTVERPSIMADVHDPGNGWRVIAPITAASEGVAKYADAVWWLTGDELCQWAMRDCGYYHAHDYPASSGVLTVMAALHAGCNPIVLVGHDLAAAPDGTTHAASAAPLAHGLRDILRPSAPQRQHAVTVDADGTATSYLWQQMRDCMETEIARYAPKRSIYRVGRGLSIAGVLDIDAIPFFSTAVDKNNELEDEQRGCANILPRLVCAMHAMQDVRVVATAVARGIENGTTGADAAAACLQLSRLCAQQDAHGLLAYLLQTVYNQAHLRIALARDFAATVHRLARTLANHADTLSDGMARLVNDLTGGRK